jgi:hypothetical protein
MTLGIVGPTGWQLLFNENAKLQKDFAEDTEKQFDAILAK